NRTNPASQIRKPKCQIGPRTRGRSVQFAISVFVFEMQDSSDFEFFIAGVLTYDAHANNVSKYSHHLVDFFQCDIESGHETDRVWPGCVEQYPRLERGFNNSAANCPL